MDNDNTHGTNEEETGSNRWRIVLVLLATIVLLGYFTFMGTRAQVDYLVAGFLIGVGASLASDWANGENPFEFLTRNSE